VRIYANQVMFRELGSVKDFYVRQNQVPFVLDTKNQIPIPPNLDAQQKALFEKHRDLINTHAKFLNSVEVNMVPDDMFERVGFNEPFSCIHMGQIGISYPRIFGDIVALSKFLCSEHHAEKVCVIDSLTIHQNSEIMLMQHFLEGLGIPHPQKMDMICLMNYEFSQSICKLIKPPRIVTRGDWQNKLSSYQEQNQKYLNICPRGSFCDVTISPNGASCWYHICAGNQILYMVEPTKENLDSFNQYLGDSPNRQTFEFFTSRESCKVITISKGETVCIPAGWIYAVYNMTDSVTLFGYFFHSYSVSMNLQIQSHSYDDGDGSSFTKMYWEIVHDYCLKLRLGNFQFSEPEFKGLIDLLIKLTMAKLSEDRNFLVRELLAHFFGMPELDECIKNSQFVAFSRNLQSLKFTNAHEAANMVQAFRAYSYRLNPPVSQSGELVHR